MSDLPVPAVLTILVLVLLVLVVLVVLGVRGRRGAAAPAGTEPEQGGEETERQSSAPAAEAAEPADAPEDPADAPEHQADAESIDTEPADAVAADEAPDLENPVDEDPRPWRERHGRRASRPLLSERSAARTAEEELAPAQSWESAREAAGEPRR
ncbi:hypothetical protein [Brachybacterium paraconglomeratum]|uniref:hypothetical protein n=1 Tax=Brachybacterium paraconglomeratum TaxID=173362 RepID=UPI0022DF54C7|nr:hypothetical protein [Brachybacterium paraconglomeratum]